MKNDEITFYQIYQTLDLKKKYRDLVDNILKTDKKLTKIF